MLLTVVAVEVAITLSAAVINNEAVVTALVAITTLIFKSKFICATPVTVAVITD